MPRENSIRRALKERRVVTGLIHFIGSPIVIEVMAAAGLDFVIIDMEHSPLDLDRLGHLIRAADAAGITPFVRVPGVDEALIKKVLNLGAMGIALPHANRENCAALVRALRYAPEGDRGACPMVRGIGYDRSDWAGRAARANAEVMAIPLLEDKASIDDFPALAAMPGLDVFFLGPTDLSISLGVPGALFDDPKMGAALDTMVEHARRHGRAVMTTLSNRQDPAYAKALAQRGVQMVVFGTDCDVLLDACRRMDEMKRGLP